MQANAVSVELCGCMCAEEKCLDGECGHFCELRVTRENTSDSSSNLFSDAREIGRGKSSYDCRPLAAPTDETVSYVESAP